MKQKVELPTSDAWRAQTKRDSIPPSKIDSIVDWGRENVRMPKSAMSVGFDPDMTPWIREPIDKTDLRERRSTTLVKPIQSAGTTGGEVLLCYWITFKSYGDIQYNWPNDEHFKKIWDNRFEPILKSTEAVMAVAPGNAARNTGAWKRGVIQLPNRTFTMQGIHTARNVASESIRCQLNEELHVERDGWEPGRLQQANGRCTAVWDHSIVNISNAGRKGGELDKAFHQGTQQHWQILCPDCGRFHIMRTHWRDTRPDLGGLRYDSDGCRRDDGTYDYTRLAGTVRYQMPCGFVVHDPDISTRRAMNKGGKYSDPMNEGAPVSLASYIFEAVSVDYIPWLSLIIQKHEALKARRFGDSGPYMKYLRERECIFSSEEDYPSLGVISLKQNVVKDRDGLPEPRERFAALDYQQGVKARGEFPHWWLVIVDAKVLPNGRLQVRLVFEGKVDLDEEVAVIIARHEVSPRMVVADSGHNAMHVYQFCLKHGYSAIKGSGEGGFSHPAEDPAGNPVTVLRIFQQERPIHGMLNMDETRQDPIDEPQFWLYSKHGIRERYSWLASGGGGLIDFEIPEDVSEDFLSHHDAEEPQWIESGKTRQKEKVWVQLRPRNDLFVCMCYIAMLLEMAGLIGIDSDMGG